MSGQSGTYNFLLETYGSEIRSKRLPSVHTATRYIADGRPLAILLLQQCRGTAKARVEVNY